MFQNSLSSRIRTYTPYIPNVVLCIKLRLEIKVEGMGIEPNSQWLQTNVALPWYMSPLFYKNYSLSNSLAVKTRFELAT